MKEIVIISLADSNYFELLDELVESIKSFKESEKTAICILDAGLTEDQKKILLEKVYEIKSAEWDIEVPDFKVKEKNGSKVKSLELFFQDIFQIIKIFVDRCRRLGKLMGSYRTLF